MKTLNWKPKKRGNIFCSSACGGQCTWASYQKAVHDSLVLAMRLGPEWKARVWENLGWHWSVQANLKGVYLDVSGHPGSYRCLISDAFPGVGTPGLYDNRDFKTPEAAIAASWKILKARAEALHNAVELMRSATLECL